MTMKQADAKIEVSAILEQLTLLHGRLKLVLQASHEFTEVDGVEYTIDEALDIADDGLEEVIGHTQNAYDAM